MPVFFCFCLPPSTFYLHYLFCCVYLMPISLLCPVSAVHFKLGCLFSALFVPPPARLHLDFHHCLPLYHTPFFYLYFTVDFLFYYLPYLPPVTCLPWVGLVRLHTCFVLLPPFLSEQETSYHTQSTTPPPYLQRLPDSGSACYHHCFMPVHHSISFSCYPLNGSSYHPQLPQTTHSYIYATYFVYIYNNWCFPFHLHTNNSSITTIPFYHCLQDRDRKLSSSSSSVAHQSDQLAVGRFLPPLRCMPVTAVGDIATPCTLFPCLYLMPTFSAV